MLITVDQAEQLANVTRPQDAEAFLHRSPLPPMPPAAAHGLPAAHLLPRRIADRFAELAAFAAALPAAPPAGRLAAVLVSRPGGRLVHLDVRAPNIRCTGSTVCGLLDWSNARCTCGWSES